ncbi:hypothetical protein [Thermomonas fusca]|uniref:hypothetical protein n=1 Tax=Thermomonas fusca TaxID=215690 RepID=UPI0003F84B22|nr:hypothetical protein [Thermomonas fusca]
MNTHPTDRLPMDAGADARFDAAIRTRHATALAQLSPQVRAQLAQRRVAALRGERPGARRHRLRFAVAGFAALSALALGVRLYPQEAPPGAAPASTQLANSTGGSLPLDEDPDFYAWLGSADAPRLAME